MKRKRSWLTITLSILSAASVSWLAVQLLDRRPVLRIESVIVTPNPVTAGQPITITWTAREFRSCDGEVIRWITDSRGRVYEYNRISSVVKIPQGPQPRTFFRELQLAKDISPGRAAYTSRVIRWCNVVQRVLWPMTEESPAIPFVVK